MNKNILETMTSSQKCVGYKTLSICDGYKEIKCIVNNRFPYVCTSCKYILCYKRTHYIYDPNVIEQRVNNLNRDYRANNLNRSVKTIYNYSHKGQISVKPIDLFIEYFGEDFLNKLNLKIVEPKDVKIIRYDRY